MGRRERILIKIIWIRCDWIDKSDSTTTQSVQSQLSSSKRPLERINSSIATSFKKDTREIILCRSSEHNSDSQIISLPYILRT